MAEIPAPRLVVTDALGRRIVPIDKALFTIGRRSETDLRLPGADISRVHAEISSQNGTCVIRDKQSRFGTFVNGERVTERTLAHGDQIRFGQAGDTEIVFFVDDEAPSVEKSAVSAASELRQMAALLEGLRALGSGRVIDEVLALVLDSAIEVTGAERGFIMLANREKQLEFKMARARGKVTLPGKTFETSRKIPETVFATGRQTIVEDLLDGDLAQLHTGTVALGIRHVLCTPLRLVRYVERAEEATDDKMIGVLYLDSRERGALRSAQTRSALDTLSSEAAGAVLRNFIGFILSRRPVVPVGVGSRDQVVVDRLGLVAREHVGEARHAVRRALPLEHDGEERGVGLRRHVAQVLDPAARRHAVAQRAVLAVEPLAERDLPGRAGLRGRRAQLGDLHRGGRQRRQLRGAAGLEHQQARLRQEQLGVSRALDVGEAPAPAGVDRDVLLAVDLVGDGRRDRHLLHRHLPDLRAGVGAVGGEGRADGAPTRGCRRTSTRCCP